jgi:hypothetical protein
MNILIPLNWVHPGLKVRVLAGMWPCKRPILVCPFPMTTKLYSNAPETWLNPIFSLRN